VEWATIAGPPPIDGVTNPREELPFRQDDVADGWRQRTDVADVP
jgi:hypothetical protein